MRHITLSGTDLQVSNVIAGMMRIRDKSDAEIRELVAAALDAGINFFDHADVYGADYHQCEQRFADALGWSSAQREQVVLQTKAGIVWSGEGWQYFDFSAAHLIEAVEGSLKALRTDYIDILLLHRPDALVEPEEVAEAFSKLEAAGKVRHFGVSNQTPRQIDLLKTAVEQPLIVNQLQLSITHSPILGQGLATNMLDLDQSITRDGGGIVEYCRINDITIQAWSPFQHGFFDGVFLGDRERNPKLNDVLERLAAKYGVEPIAIATAWITRHPGGFQVVLGTTTPTRVTAAAQGSDIELTKREWYELTHAGGNICP
ncbi:MAG: aldo/keto reductase [Propionibacteriaceae bacterium]|jgi:predicted oxidoreductase|nr:aldo/keto reductase [Propionibacteriaceae bacterium]